MSTPTVSSESPWQRLHPLSPAVRVSRLFVVLQAIVIPRVGAGARALPYAELAVFAVVLLSAVVYWLVTRWRVHNGELQVETGLLRRQSIRVPLTRIQAIDIVRPLAARVIGLSELRIDVAGHGERHTRLAYLSLENAEVVRARLLALAHGLHAETPEPAERPIAHVDLGRLLAASLLADAAPLLVLFLFIGISVATAVHDRAGLFGVLPALVAAVLTAGRRVNAEYDFTVAEAPDGVRLRSGLLQTQAETIPYARIQAIRCVEPLLWRPFRWARLEIDVARRVAGDRNEADARLLSRALLAVGTRDEAAWLLARVLPGASIDPPPGARPPQRAAWRAPLSYWNLAAWHDNRYTTTRTGRLRRAVTVVPLHKVQSLRWVQGPLQRKLTLATVHVDTAGRRWQAVARCRDAMQSRQLVDELAELARTARRTIGA